MKHPNDPCHLSRRGFSLVELLVVMGIIILFIALAVPAVRAITGTRSIAGAENNVSALLARAREEAIGVQEVRGILFYLDPATDGVAGAIVRAADVQDVPGILLLDTVPSRDYLVLPKGVRLQTIFDGQQMSPRNRYLGFNTDPNGGPLPGQDAQYMVKLGGVILFDADGHLVVRNYGFQFARFGAGNRPSGLADLLHITPTGGKTTYQLFTSPSPSQLGFVLFDKEAFFSHPGFYDGDFDGDSVEEEWLNTNATHVLINRYTGTLIRGE